MLVHICCSVDSHYFLEQIQKEYPKEELVGYFYDPNIHPYSEYRLRYLDVEYSCKKLGIKLLEGAYNLEEWLNKVKGMEHLPEKGDRCTVCYDDRLETTAKKALELGHDKFTSTLLISPKKSQEKLEKIGEKLEKETGLEFVFKDYRSNNGTQIQGQVVKKHSFYRQNYCGCLFGLMPQRQAQKKVMDEMFNPISKQILPESIEERLQLYKKRDKFEEQNKEYKIIKQRFLNYRLFRGKVAINKEVIPSYFICYSTTTKIKTSSRIEYHKDGIYYLNKESIKVLTLDTFNFLSNSSYKSVKSLMYNPLHFEDELKVRNKIVNNAYDLSAIIVIDKIIDGKFDLELEAQTYNDVKEEII